MNKDLLEIGLMLFGVMLPVFVYFVKLEKRLTKIETLLTCLLPEKAPCLHTLDKDIR